MADSFQPKFVDLVRNFTTTVGTGNLVLGDPVPGFASFNSALGPGDSFYYSAIGLEKGTEVEVGRGTLQPDGSIAREPISGTFTDFSPGRKAVALVAAAEWFEALDAVRGAPKSATGISELAALPASGAALLDEAGREGLFVFDGSDLSAEVSADSAQGLYVAPDSDTSGASGAWVRKFADPLNPLWFGMTEGAGIASSVRDSNDAAWTAMRAVQRVRAINATTSFEGLETIQFPPGQFEFNSTIDLYGVGVIEGAGIAGSSGHPTILKFFDCTGLRLQGATSFGYNGYNASLGEKGSSGTILRNLAIYGNYSSGAEAEHHGIQARARFTAENVVVSNFAGDGYHIHADTHTNDGVNPPAGAANGWRIIGGRVASCRNGISTKGGDANAGSATQLDIALCRQWGVDEDSLLGNNYYSCKIASCGRADMPAGNVPSMVFHTDGRYGVIDGQEAGASTNAPSGTGTDNSWWYFIESAGGANSRAPQWVSGTTYRAGGSVRSANVGAAAVFDGCYMEGDQASAQTVATTTVRGGLLAPRVRKVSTQGPVVAANGDLVVAPSIRLDAKTSSGATGNVIVGQKGMNAGGQSFLPIIQASHSALAPSTFRLKLLEFSGTLRLDYANNANSYVFDVTTPGGTAQFGTGVNQAFWFHPFRLAVGDSITNARLVSNGAAPPSTDPHGEGEWIFNRAPSSADAPIGWRCRSAGTPGIWDVLYPAVRGLSFHCAGRAADDEVLGGGIAPYAMTLSATASSCRALVAPTGAVLLSIRKNGSPIGDVAFVASDAIGTVSFTDTAVAAGDHITIHNAATADETLADITGLLRE